MTTWIYNRTDELTHYGIKGQKWGKRRFQYEDGSLTPAGKERYDDDGPSERSSKESETPKVKSSSKGTTSETKQKEYKIPENKSKHRLNLENKYKSQGLSEKEAEQAAAKRIRAEQYTAAAAAVTVTACVAYCKYKNYADDKVYKSGTEFQRIMALNKDQPIHEGRQYLAVNKLDKLKYRGVYAKELAGKVDADKELYNVTVKAKQDIKVASRKNAQKAFRELYDTDEKFREGIKKQAESVGRAGIADKHFGKSFEKILDDKPMTNKDKNKYYDYFNRLLAVNDDDTNDKFYKKLAEKGYNAIQDRNDQKYSGYNTKNPLITFDGKYDYTKNKMVQELIEKDAKKGLALIYGKSVGGTVGGYTAVMAGRTKLNNMQVEKYKREHPNTRMTDKEIKAMLKREGLLL